jgi:hypothetical protein
MNDATLLVLGAMAGAVQAAFLARSVRGKPGAASAVARLGIVAMLLFVAASAGHLMAASVGWLAGFGGAGTVVYHRLPRRRS